MAGLREAGLCNAIGVAPGPANGFTLDVIGCLERFGDLIDWAMLILNPLEPWPGRLALPACERHGVRVLARVVDYGGLFHDDVPDEGSLGETDHRRYRAAGWVEAGRARLDELRPIADRHGLTLLQLSVRLDARAARRGLRRADAHPGGRAAAPRRSRPSAPSSPPCRAGRCSTRPSWPRSRRSATTPAA